MHLNNEQMTTSEPEKYDLSAEKLRNGEKMDMKSGLQFFFVSFLPRRNKLERVGSTGGLPLFQSIFLSVIITL